MSKFFAGLHREVVATTTTYYHSLLLRTKSERLNQSRIIMDQYVEYHMVTAELAPQISKAWRIVALRDCKVRQALS